VSNHQLNHQDLEKKPFNVPFRIGIFSNGIVSCADCKAWFMDVVMELLLPLLGPISRSVGLPSSGHLDSGLLFAVGGNTDPSNFNPVPLL